jgi:hypothetical protein
VWPFQRKTEAPADSGSRPVPAPVIRRDWTGLPPIQRLVGEHPLTAPSDRFSDDLATHHDPSVSTEPMGHQVSVEAPAGIVLALARPTTRNDGPAMISRPRVQRRVQSAIAESGEWDGDEAASPAMRPSPLPAGTPPAAVRQLPVVAPALVAQRLTALSPDVEPMPVESAPRRSRIEKPLDLSVASHAEPADAPVPAARLTLGQARRLGLGAPISRVPGRAVQRAITHATEMLLAPSSVPQPSSANEDAEPPRADRTSGSSEGTSTSAPLDLPLAPHESTRIPQSDPAPQGGTEITANPVLAPPLVQRSFQRESPLVAIENSAEPALPLAIAQRAPTLPSSASGGGELWASPAKGRGELLASRASGGEEFLAPTLPSAAREGGEFLAPTLPSAARAGGELRGELAPLVSARPLRPTTLQRSTEPSPVDFSPAEQLADGTTTRGNEIVLPSPRGASRNAPTQSLFSPELSPVPMQQRYGPIQASPLGHRLQRQAQSEQSLGRAAEMPLAPLQRAAAEVAPEPSEPGDESTSEVVQRGMFDSLSSEVSGLSSRVPSPAEAGSAVSTAGSAIGSLFGGHKAAETDMDELAGKLYDKIRTRLKSELLVDRERAGFLTDLR